MTEFTRATSENPRHSEVIADASRTAAHAPDRQSDEPRSGGLPHAPMTSIEKPAMLTARLTAVASPHPTVCPSSSHGTTAGARTSTMDSRDRQASSAYDGDQRMPPPRSRRRRPRAVVARLRGGAARRSRANPPPRCRRAVRSRAAAPCRTERNARAPAVTAIPGADARDADRHARAAALRDGEAPRSAHLGQRRVEHCGRADAGPRCLGRPRAVVGHVDDQDIRTRVAARRPRSTSHRRGAASCERPR